MLAVIAVWSISADAVARQPAGGGQAPVRHEVRTTKFTIADVDTSIAFYEKLLGMTEVGRFVDEGRLVEPFMGFGPGGRVGLLAYTAKETVEKSVHPVTVLYVPDLDPVARRFKDADYPLRLLSGPVSGRRVAIARDPSGNAIEVVERPGAAAVGGAKLIVDDREKAEAFFVRIFGASPGRRFQTATFDEVLMDFGDGMFVALFEPKGEPRRAKSEHPVVAIYTRDSDAVLARVKAEGLGYVQRGTVVFAKDPAGNVVEIVPMPAR
jgi:catechol 2,3-dioxygenase-like lactoylglutathione lyase family enzyme